MKAPFKIGDIVQVISDKAPNNLRGMKNIRIYDVYRKHENWYVKIEPFRDEDIAFYAWRFELVSKKNTPKEAV